ncbi:MAG: FixH family protein [Chitinophagales bacterium]|nr:FixH family protein [Bacteroidota bacterium]MCB9044305.1 FixH family protein [Chitinophagales bacterium]
MKVSGMGIFFVVFFGGFIAMILFLVVASVREDFTLVTDDYYAQEIAYQQHIDRVQNTRTLETPFEYNFDKAKQILYFQFPTLATAPQGDIYFYRPSDASLDFKVPIAAPNFEQQISTKELQIGYWQVKVTWSQGETPYYYELKLTL